MRRLGNFQVFPDQPLDLARKTKLIHRNFPSLSTCYPQEIFAPKRFFVVPDDALSELGPTAKKRERQSGTRRPMSWKRKAKGHEPGAERERFGRGCRKEESSRSSLKRSSFQGRSGLRKVFGSTVTATGLRARSMWARRPLGGKVHRRRQDVSQGTMRRPRLSTWRLHLFWPPKRNEVRCQWPRTPPASEMQYRVYAPVPRPIHMTRPEINQMSAPATMITQHVSRTHKMSPRTPGRNALFAIRDSRKSTNRGMLIGYFVWGVAWVE